MGFLDKLKKPQSTPKMSANDNTPKNANKSDEFEKPTSNLEDGTDWASALGLATKADKRSQQAADVNSYANAQDQALSSSPASPVQSKDNRSSKPNKGDRAILALDIGTEYVKAVIANLTRTGELEVIGVGRTRQEANNMYAGAIADIPGVVSVCEKALSQAEKFAGLTAQTAVVGIAGELVKGNTTTIRYRRKNGDKPLTEQEMSLIIERVQERAGEQARQEIAAETDNPSVEVRLINSAIVSINIDGYKISNPIGFKGTDVVIQFYTAFAPLVHISAIEKVCAELSLDLLAVAVEPFAVCRACLGDEIDNAFSGIIMDIGGGTTDLAIINDGGVEGTKMFGIGGRSFTHQIAEILNVDFDTAEEYKIAINNPKKVPADLKEKMEYAIQRNLAVWLSGVEITLEEFQLPDMLPNRILLCGGGSGLMAIQDVLATTDWFKELPFTRRPMVHVVEPSDIPGLKNLTSVRLDHSYITALGLLRVAVDTLSGAPDESGLRAKLAKLLQS